MPCLLITAILATTPCPENISPRAVIVLCMVCTVFGLMVGREWGKLRDQISLIEQFRAELKDKQK